MEVWVKALKLIGSEAPRESFASSSHGKHDQIAHLWIRSWQLSTTWRKFTEQPLKVLSHLSDCSGKKLAKAQ
jgi:hypothetical protein